MSEKHFTSFSVGLTAPVWNLLQFAGKPLLIIEQRDEVKRRASFSAYNYEQRSFLWRDIVLPEKWWVNLAGISNNYIVLKVFESTENPDKTSFLFLDPESGNVTQHDHQQIVWEHTNNALQPFQYLAGEPDFETVKNFVKSKRNLTPLLGAEYLEYADYVIISYYAGDPNAFINWLAIYNVQGECLYEDEIGTNLKGMGINTFFIASGHLFFVKNKTELVTFRIV